MDSESEHEFSTHSEEELNSDSVDVLEESNGSDNDDVSTAELLKTFKHVQHAFAGFAKIVEKKGNRRQPTVHTRSSKRSKTLRGSGKGKSIGGASTSERPGSRFNSKYFGEKIIGNLDERKKKIIRDHGFGMLLEYDGCSAPRGFVQWIADQVDLNCRDIVVGGKVIPFTPLSVHLFLGLPIDGEDIKENYNDSSKTKFLKAIKESSLPLIKTFGDQLLGNTLSDDNVFRYFMVVALSTFLCANSSTVPSPQYLGALIDVSTVKEWNWSKFVFDWMFASISNYRNKNRSTIGGCRYFLAGYYLDFVRFGLHHEVPTSLPRINCWKSSMITKFASYDRVSGHMYGKRPVLSLDETCYAEEYLPEEACASFRRCLDKSCGFIAEEDRANLTEIFESHHTRFGFRRPGPLVSKMFKYMHLTHVVGTSGHGGGASVEAETSAGRVPPPADGDGDHAVPVENVVPVPCPGHGGNVENVLDATVPPVATATSVKKVALDADVDKVDVGVVAGGSNTGDKEDGVSVAAAGDGMVHEVENSETEILESDGLVDPPEKNVGGASVATEILPGSNSSGKSSVAKRNLKRKDGASPSSSPDSIGSRTRRGVHHRLGKSPLSYKEGGKSGDIGSKENPVCIDDLPAITSKSSRKRQKSTGKSAEPTSAGTVPIIDSSKSKEAVLPDNAGGGPTVNEPVNAPVDGPSMVKTDPYFNSPSMPSFRLLDDEDDLGQFVEDPNLRRPVGADPVGGSSNVRNEDNVDNVRNENDVIHMESLPFTDSSENGEESCDPVPLAALNPSGQLVFFRI